jgi:hypothetical protein
MRMAVVGIDTVRTTGSEQQCDRQQTRPNPHEETRRP